MEKSKNIEKLFLHIVYYSYLIIPLVFLLSHKKVKNKISVALAIYGLIFFCFLFAYEILPKKHRALYQSAYTYLEYLFLAFFLWSTIAGKFFRKIILVSSVLFLFFQIIYFFTTEHARLDSIPIGIETILLFVFIIYFFIEYYQTMDSGYIYYHYGFWLSLGILIYLGGSFFFYILINSLSKEQVDAFGNLTYLAEIIKNILFAVALFICNRNSVKNKITKPSNVPYLDMV